VLSLVIPKGSLERATLDLFDAADLTVRRSSDRDYHASIDDPRIERVRFLRPQEIPAYVEQGLFDFGITGRDWITETGADVESLGELQYSKATSDPVRVVLAVPASVPWQSVADLPEGIRVSTEFPALTRRYLEAHGIKAVVIPSYGATEAKVPDIVDAIVDLTETGASLGRNGLRILDTLLTSYTELIANPWYTGPTGASLSMISARPPNAAAGSPPPMTFPKVIRSPATPSRPNQPAFVTRNPVSTSSMISSAPCSAHSPASSSLNPAAGGTTPMLAGQASVITHAISSPLAANAWRTAAASL